MYVISESYVYGTLECTKDTENVINDLRLYDILSHLFFVQLLHTFYYDFVNNILRFYSCLELA